MRRRFGLLIGFAVAALGTMSLEPLSALAQENPPAVRLGYFNGPRPWILAKADGSFDKAFATKVEWVLFPSGAAALSALAAGEVDISRLGSSPTVAAIARKLPIEFIAVSGVIATSERLIARKTVPNVKALEGRAVAYPPGSTAHYALQAAFQVHKVDVPKVRQVELRPAEMLAAWQRGDIDAAYVWGPFSHQMEAANGHQLLVTKDLQSHGYFVWNDYVVRKEFAERYPHIVVKFLQVFADTVDRYKKDPNGSADIIAKTLDQNVDFARDTLAGL
ncbi:MAG TPA: ABC transporter substrate-binding protein, partial [Pseudolabrys sp.]|nr:ABC transporter substrate-binding protein [Pseudolabrys sp.]